MIKASPFDDFHLGDSLRFRSLGLRTMFTLSEDTINQRKRRIVAILEKYAHTTPIETSQGVELDLADVRSSSIPRITKLLEENSILLEAQEYLASDICREWKSIPDITQSILLLRIEIMRNQAEKVDIYNFVDLAVGEILQDFLMDIHFGMYIPTEKEAEDLEGLQQARQRFLDFLNHPRGAIMIG